MLLSLFFVLHIKSIQCLRVFILFLLLLDNSTRVSRTFSSLSIYPRTLSHRITCKQTHTIARAHHTCTRIRTQLYIIIFEPKMVRTILSEFEVPSRPEQHVVQGISRTRSGPGNDTVHGDSPADLQVYSILFTNLRAQKR